VASSVKQIINRLRYIEGQAQGIQRMLAEGRPSAEVIVQLRAVESAAAGARELYSRNLIEKELLRAVAERLTAQGERLLSPYDLVTIIEEMYDGQASEKPPRRKRRNERAKPPPGG
jgi:DNA-binding FrmR family transcriptional regulator